MFVFCCSLWLTSLSLPGTLPWNSSSSPMPFWVSLCLRPWVCSVWWWRSLSCSPCEFYLSALSHSQLISGDWNSTHSLDRGYAIPTKLSLFTFPCTIFLLLNVLCKNSSQTIRIKLKSVWSVSCFLIISAVNKGLFLRIASDICGIVLNMVLTFKEISGC